MIVLGGNSFYIIYQSILLCKEAKSQTTFQLQ